MKKLQNSKIWQVMITIIGVGAIALLPLEHVGASSLSTTTLSTKGQNSAGTDGDIHKSQARALSDDGRITVFSSQATNLVSGPHNGMEQVYAYDRITKKTELVSRNAEGGPGSGGSYVPTISADGRYVAYASTARDVAPGLNDFCKGWDDPCTNIIVHDLITKYTRVANVDSKKKRLPSIHTGLGGEAPVITRDGRFVTFLSYHPFNTNGREGYRLIVRNLEEQSTHVVELTNADDQISESAFWNATIDDTGRYIAFSTDERLASNDYNGQDDIYLYDIKNSQDTILVTSGLMGFGASHSFEPVISTDGNSIVYESTAENLIPDDRNKKTDIFLFNRQKVTTTLVSRSTKGTPASDNSFGADVNGDGQYVVYASYAPNLVRPNTTNINVFLHYTNFGVTRLISRASYNGIPGDNHSLTPSISQNGKAITFTSRAHNLTNDTITQNTLFSNLFMAYDVARATPYYDQTDLLELF